jgi:hypothetical protein
VLVLESDSLNNNKLYGLLNQNWKKKKKGLMGERVT